jgi:hypothetical protein
MGTWWQSGYPYVEKLNSYTLGIRYDECRGGWCLGSGIVTHGHVSVSSLDDPNDLDYRLPINQRQYKPSHYNGGGGTWGFFTAVGKQFGAVTAEVGVSLLKPSWTVNVPDGHFSPGPDCPAQNITVSHRSHLQPGLVAGLRYRLTNKVSVELSAWQTASHGDEWVSLYKRTYAFTVGYSF